MYKEFSVNFHRGLRKKDSPRIFEDGECGIAQDCFLDERGNIFSRKFIQDTGTGFNSEIKTIAPYINGDKLLITLSDGSLYDGSGNSIGSGMGALRQSHVEYDNTMHFAPSLKRYDNTNLQNIGNVAPEDAPSVAIGSNTLITDCNSVWTGSSNVTPFVDQHDFQVNPSDPDDISSAKMVLGPASTSSPAAKFNFSSIDLTDFTHVSLWVKTSKDIDAGDLALLLDDSTDVESPLETLELPALFDDVWTNVVLELSDPSALTAIIGVGIEVPSDIGTIRIHLDYIIAMDESNLDGEYFYKYTYVDSNGRESTASPVSDAINPKDQNVSIGVVASSVSKVSFINLYRIGGTLSVYNLIEQVSNTTQTITDMSADIDLSVIFNALENDKPETGLSILQEHYERIIGARDSEFLNSIYFSVQYQPEYWGDNLSQQFLISNKDECTGLLSWGKYIIYTKKNKIFVFEGSNPPTWHERLSDSSYGNLSPHALVFYKLPIFLSYPGLFFFNINNEESFSEIIREFFVENKDFLSTAITSIFDDKLFLSIGDQVLVYDFKIRVFYTYDISLSEIRYSFLDNILYAGDSDFNLIRLEQDTNPGNFDSVNFIIKSKAYPLHDIPNQQGQLRDFIVNINTFNQDITLNIYIDEKLKQSITLSTKVMEYIRRSFDSTLKGRYVEFEFVGEDLTKQIEIQPPLIINPEFNK